MDIESVELRPACWTGSIGLPARELSTGAMASSFVLLAINANLRAVTERGYTIK